MVNKLVVYNNENIDYFEELYYDTYTGSESPINSLGNNGDYYFQTGSNTELVYKKINNAWVLQNAGGTGVGGITGPQGIQGVTGISGVGSTGIQGATGPIAGSDTQVIFNDNGVAAGNPSLTFNKTTDTLSITGQVFAGDLSNSENHSVFSVQDNPSWPNGNMNFNSNVYIIQPPAFTGSGNNDCSLYGSYTGFSGNTWNVTVIDACVVPNNTILLTPGSFTGIFQVGETVTDTTSSVTGIIIYAYIDVFSGNTVLVFDSMSGTFIATDTILGNTSNATGPISAVQSTAVKNMLIFPTSSISGIFQVGENVTDITSGATATISYINIRGENTILTLTNMVGPFNLGGVDTIQGNTSEASALIIETDATDIFNWTDSVTSGSSGFELGSFLMTYGMYFQAGNTIGHTLGDSWSLTVSANSNQLLSISGGIGADIKLGDFSGAGNHTTFEINDYFKATYLNSSNIILNTNTIIINSQADTPTLIIQGVSGQTQPFESFIAGGVGVVTQINADGGVAAPFITNHQTNEHILDVNNCNFISQNYNPVLNFSNDVTIGDPTLIQNKTNLIVSDTNKKITSTGELEIFGPITFSGTGLNDIAFGGIVTTGPFNYTATITYSSVNTGWFNVSSWLSVSTTFTPGETITATPSGQTGTFKIFDLATGLYFITGLSGAILTSDTLTGSISGSIATIDSFAFTDLATFYGTDGTNNVDFLIQPYPTANWYNSGLQVTFASTTGHTIGDNWAITVSPQIEGTMLNIDYQNRTLSIGDTTEAVNGTKLVINDPTQTVAITGNLTVSGTILSNGLGTNVKLTGQTSSINSTTLVIPDSDGLFQLSVNVTGKVMGGGSITVIAAVGWTDETSTTHEAALSPVLVNPGSFGQQVIIASCKSGTPITYRTVLSSQVGNPQYSFYFVATKLA